MLKAFGVLYFNLLDTIVNADKSLSYEELRRELNKKFRMKGIVVSDLKVIKMMDNKLEPSTASEQIPVYLDKEGKVSIGKSSAIDVEKFERLQKYTKYIIKEIAKEIYSGKIDLKPYNLKKKTPCEYCEYKSICNFDSKMEGNEYNFIGNKGREIILEEINQQSDE